MTSTGDEAVELAAMVGLELDPWEAHVLRESLGEREDGKWSAFEVGLCVPRQNGKGSILEARELAGLFLLDERLIIHSAHLIDTSLEHFQRLLNLIEETPDFDRRVHKVSNTNGREGIELKGGQRIRFRTRTKGGARGFTGDLVVFDEAMDIPTATHNSILPTLAARSISGNPQVWYTGSAVDQWVHDNGLVFAGVRERGIAGAKSLAYFDWSPDCDNPAEADELLDDPEAWAEANPGLGIRISHEHVERERAAMDARGFAVERLGIGDWPSADGQDQRVIAAETIDACADADSQVQDPVTFAFDVTPDRSYSSIGVAGKRADNFTHIELVDRKRGTGWVVEAIVALSEVHGSPVIRCEGYGPAGSLVPKLEAAGIEVEVLSSREHSEACGELFDAFEQQSVRFRGEPEVLAALKGAVKRPLGDSWAWSRKNSTVDISPLVACTLAHWGASTESKPKEPLVAWRSRRS